jgi:hypothetical protein
MIHPHTELRRVSSDIGYGVYATAPIPRGTITWVLDALDLVMPRERAAAMPRAYQPILERYCFIDDRGNSVLCWDLGRYTNHACEPTTVSIGSVCDVAARDIAAGEEITCEYALLNISEVITCRCGSPRCRGQVQASDLAALAPGIDRLVSSLVPLVGKQPQVLLDFMLPAQRERLNDVLAGRAPIPSVLENQPSDP